MWDLLSTCRTRSDMGGLLVSLTAASGSDSAQSMLQQHQSHLLRCLQACLAEQQPVWQITSLRLRVVSTPSHQGYWQGPVAQCQCLVTSTYMCGTSYFTSTLSTETKN